MDLEIQIGQFLEKIGQISVWLQAIGLTGLDDAVNRGTGSAPLGEALNNQFFRPMVKFRMARSQILFVMAASPYSG